MKLTNITWDGGSSYNKSIPYNQANNNNDAVQTSKEICCRKIIISVFFRITSGI